MKIVSGSVLFFALFSFPFFGHAADFSVRSIDGIPISETQAIQNFYQNQAEIFLWVDHGQLTSEAKDIVRDIGESWKQGLNPLNYQYTILNEYVKNGIPQGREVDIEILFSNAFIKYAQDLSGMRLSPQELKEDSKSWSRGVDGYSLLSILSQTSKKAEFIQNLLPSDKTYQRLSKELTLIVEDLAKTPEPQIKPVKYPGLLKPGVVHPAIVNIRQKLGLSGESTLYDDDLKKQVEAFQSRHGLAPDGLIGPRSFNAIYQTRTQKLVKLIANLERRRWVRLPMPSRYIAVNIPQMQLEAVDAGKVVFEMPVIIGQDKRPTTSFVANIVGVRFNPLWYVPETIKKEDYLPALQKNPEALRKKGIQFRVRSEEGMKKVAASEINWNQVDQETLKSIQMYQDSGGENALGLIRVLMPNPYDIYLHDTNAPELFKKDDRALSSGCVRMSEPDRIANFILSVNNGWAEEKIKKYVTSKKLIEIKAEKPLPVYLFYYTAWLDKKGDVIIANDLYQKDVDLVRALQSKGKIPFDLK